MFRIFLQTFINSKRLFKNHHCKPFLILFIILSLSQNCTGVYYGIDGPNVMDRNEAVAKLNRALFLKSAECGFDEKNVSLLLNNYTVNPRKVLDGAYYARKDVEACEKRILLSD